MRRALAAAAAVVLWAAAAHADTSPSVSPAFPLDSPPFRSQPEQRYEEISFDGTNYLVVWEDLSDTLGTYCRLVAARVTQDGVVLDQPALQLSDNCDGNGSQSQRRISVGFDGQAWLVAWVAKSSNMPVVLVRRDGTFSAMTVLPTEAVAGSQASSPSVAGNPDTGGFLVAWQSTRAYAARVSPDGLYVPNSTVTVPGSVPILAHVGGRYLLVTTRAVSSVARVFVRQASDEGVLLGTAAIELMTPGSAGSPHVATDGTTALITYRTSDGMLGGALVDGNLQLLSLHDIAGPCASRTPNPTSLSWMNGAYITEWNDDCATPDYSWTGAIVAPDGTATTIPLISPTLESVVGGGQNGFLTVWRERVDGVGLLSPGGYVLYAANYDASGHQLGTPFPLGTRPVSEYAPAVTYDGAHFVSAWTDSRDTGGVYGVRFDSEGRVLDVPAWQAIPRRPTTAAGPLISGGGGQSLIVATISDGQTMVTVDASGVPGAAVSPGATMPPHLVWNGQAFVGAGYSATAGVYFRRFDGEGSPVDADPISLWPASNTGPAVDVGCDSVSGRCLVAWHYGGASATFASAVRIDADGTVLDSVPFSLPTDTNTGPGSVAIAVSNGMFVVVAAKQAALHPVWAFRIGVDGTLLDATGIALLTNAAAGGFSATATGGHVLVAFGNAPTIPQVQSDGTKMYGVVLELLEPPVVGARFTIATDWYAGACRVSADNDHTAVVTYAALGTTLGNPRAVARLLDFAPLPQGSNCDASWHCGSGVCADGVCCDVPCGDSTTDCVACSVAAGATADGTCSPLDSMTCDSGDLCLPGGLCSRGECVGTPVECANPPECMASGCDPETGQCFLQAVINGTPCSEGSCESGVCVAPDAGPPDAGEPWVDAGMDGGIEDAGEPSLDGGFDDAGDQVVDAGQGDAGDLSDDAGIDGGSDDAGFVDLTPPLIVCPANVEAAASSPAGAMVWFPDAFATDDASLPTVTYSAVSGSIFAPGVTSIVATATDGAGNQSACTFDVTVTITEVDAGFPEVDAGVADAGGEPPDDAGLEQDSGPAQDAGGSDDAGVELDAGASDDAGTQADAGGPDDGGLVEDAGVMNDGGGARLRVAAPSCNCSGGGSASVLWSVVAVVAALRRRRRSYFT